MLHPQEMRALIYGIVYYITIPSMYMLLVIYSLFNLNDVSWGTRENPQAATAKVTLAYKLIQECLHINNVPARSTTPKNRPHRD